MLAIDSTALVLLLVGLGTGQPPFIAAAIGLFAATSVLVAAYVLRANRPG